MSASVQYTALRSLYEVSSGETVDLDLPARYAGLSRSRRSIKNTRVSLSGARETWFARNETAYTVETIPMSLDQLYSLRMFLDSVDQGEAFLFAPDGQTALATAYLESDEYAESRSIILDIRRTVSFRIVVP